MYSYSWNKITNFWYNPNYSISKSIEIPARSTTAGGNVTFAATHESSGKGDE